MFKAILNNRAFQLASLLAFALVLNREGTWVPSGNEQIYLLYLYKAAHHGFLSTDWTFQEPTAGHLIFNVAFGWTTLLLPLNIVDWIGRLTCWTLTFIVLLRLGRRFGIAPWMAWAGIILWLVQRQSFVSNEWIIGTFEAKCVAYVCLLWAIEFILDGRIILPAILIGVAFSFHTAVGLWGGAAVVFAFAMQYPIKTTLKFVAWAAVFALPGLITSLQLVFGGRSISPAEAKFLVTIDVPFHLDPFVFGKGKIAVLFLMLLFNWLHFRSDRQNATLKFLVRFQIFAGAFFLLGILFRLTNRFSLVELFPFRVFAVLTMLMFFWQLAAAYQHRREHPLKPAVIALGTLIFFCLPSPVARLQGLAADQLPKWRWQPDDFRVAAIWVRDNTSPETVVIAPPWQKDAFYFTQRPLIADWHAPRYDAMTQWRQRIEALVGDVSQMTVQDNLAGEMDQRAQDFYQHLSVADISTLSAKYGGDLLITTSDYPYPVKFKSGPYTVYKIVR
jgi:hypothetical protein